MPKFKGLNITKFMEQEKVQSYVHVDFIRQTTIKRLCEMYPTMTKKDFIEVMKSNFETLINEMIKE